jgi:hypothetical protein
MVQCPEFSQASYDAQPPRWPGHAPATIRGLHAAGAVA